MYMLHACTIYQVLQPVSRVCPHKSLLQQMVQDLESGASARARGKVASRLPLFPCFASPLSGQR